MLTLSIYLCRTEFEFETVTDFEFEIELEIFCEYQSCVGPDKGKKWLNFGERSGSYCGYKIKS